MAMVGSRSNLVAGLRQLRKQEGEPLGQHLRRGALRQHAYTYESLSSGVRCGANRYLGSGGSVGGVTVSRLGSMLSSSLTN
jgi:hypothetical protein